MKFNFKKISAIATSVLMTGMTVGSAMAAGISPTDLGGQGNFAIVYGSTANSMDQAQATAIDTALRNQFSTSTSVVVGDVALTDDEVTLGGQVTIGSTKIASDIKSNKLGNLLKEKITWDDGSGEDEYDIEERIILSDMELHTALNKDEFTGVALTNKKGLEYRLYLDDDLDLSKVASNNSLELPILGEDYEIVLVGTDEITVTTSSEMALGVNQEYTLSNGKKVTLTGVFSGSIEVMIDGTSKIISQGNDAKVNGVRVKVEAIGYNSNSPDTSRAVLRIGEDLTKKYANTDAFIGEDEDEPNWEWSIETNSGTGTSRYIGVRYAKNTYRPTDKEIQYVGGGYSFPKNYATVTLDEITSAEYQNVKISFEEADLYVASDSAVPLDDRKVLVIETEKTDSIKLLGTTDIDETNKVYLYINSTDAGKEVQVYAYDNDGEYAPSKKARLVYNSTYPSSGITLGSIEIEDTVLNISLNGFNSSAIPTNGMIYLSLDRSSTEVLKMSVNATNLIGIGPVEEDSQSGDVSFAGTDVSTKDYSYMDYYGIKISEGTTVESEVDSDEITLSVPEERVHAKVSVSMGASTTSTGSVGNMIFRDTESSSYAGKNVVIVGGSCVNSAAATVLGVASDRGVPGCYADTGLSAGQFLIKKGLLNGKTAIVVAGYEADDTVKAAQFLINKGALEGKYTSTTSEKIA